MELSINKTKEQFQVNMRKILILISIVLFSWIVVFAQNESVPPSRNYNYEDLTPAAEISEHFVSVFRFKMVGDYTGAEKELRLILDIDPRSKRAYTELGKLYFDLGQADSAMAAYQKVLELDPSDIESLWQVGFIYFKSDKLNEAIATYKKAVELGSNKAELYSDLGLAYFILAEKQQFELKDSQEAAINYKKSLENFQKAISLNPSRAVFFSDLGLYYYSQGDLKLGKENFEKAKFIAQRLGEDYSVDERRLKYPPDVSNPPVRVMTK